MYGKRRRLPTSDYLLAFFADCPALRTFCDRFFRLVFFDLREIFLRLRLMPFLSFFLEALGPLACDRLFALGERARSPVEIPCVGGGPVSLDDALTLGFEASVGCRDRGSDCVPCVVKLVLVGRPLGGGVLGAVTPLVLEGALTLCDCCAT